MNRAEMCRRARQKKQISDEIKKAVLRQAEKQLNDGRVEAILVCMTLALHQEFGFGRERCLSGTAGCGSDGGALDRGRGKPGRDTAKGY